LASISVPPRKNQIEPAIEGEDNQISFSSSNSNKAIKRIIIRREKHIDEVSKVESRHVVKHDPIFDDFKELFEDIFEKFQILNKKVFSIYIYIFLKRFFQVKIYCFYVTTQVSDLQRQVFPP